jgi:polyisoprenoid-binding protein YceI
MSTTKWSIDRTHSEIGFKVKHMMVTNVYGRFLEFDGDAQIDEEKFDNSSFSFHAGIASIDTGNTDRDTHLKSPDFFDETHYPRLRFVSTSINKVGDDSYRILGDLTIRDKTNPVALDVEYNGLNMVDPWGQTKKGFSATGKINRKDWGLTWNSSLDAGGVLVGEDINLSLEAQFVKQN